MAYSAFISYSHEVDSELAGALRDAGWPDPDIEGFRHANWQRFLEDALP